MKTIKASELDLSKVKFKAKYYAIDRNGARWVYAVPPIKHWDNQGWDEAASSDVSKRLGSSAYSETPDWKDSLREIIYEENGMYHVVKEGHINVSAIRDTEEKVVEYATEKAQEDGLTYVVFKAVKRVSVATPPVNVEDLT